MPLEVLADEAAVGARAAALIAAEARAVVAARGRLTLALSGGSPPYPWLEALAAEDIRAAAG